MDSVVTFLMTQNPEAAIAFYRDKLGLRFLRDDGFALVFDMNGVMLRIGKAKEFTPAPNTVLG
jgi:catechol 2,3-dioxygenase-like lactoylglutathione lyase family enzyme